VALCWKPDTLAGVSGFIEPTPGLVAPNPGGDDDPLGESVLDPQQPGLRVFEPRDVRLVIGRAQDAARELVLPATVPVHRRLSGGGAVVLAPGMVVVALRLAGGLRAADDWFAWLHPRLAGAVQDACGVAPEAHGHGDLAIAGRKVLGASLRQAAARSAYLGVFLVADAVPLMERHLAHPSREPGYRGRRSHRDFCDHLARHGGTVAGLRQALERRLADAVDGAPA
jgi:lipoate-protein ligase A